MRRDISFREGTQEKLYRGIIMVNRRSDFGDNNAPGFIESNSAPTSIELHYTRSNLEIFRSIVVSMQACHA